MAVRRLADGLPLGLASSANRPVIDVVLERAGITDCFAITVSGEKVAAGKPAPRGVSHRHAPARCSTRPRLRPWRRTGASG